MKRFIKYFVPILLVSACNDSKKEAAKKDNRIYLQTDTINVVKMTDTMVIGESTCRGCAVEASTAFAIKDSLQIVKLDGVETYDNNPEGMSGGNVSKLLVIVPIKTGVTNMKMYKFWKGIPSNMTDSIAPDAIYKIEVRN